jgi:hypothetical protein
MYHDDNNNNNNNMYQSSAHSCQLSRPCHNKLQVQFETFNESQTDGAVVLHTYYRCGTLDSHKRTTAAVLSSSSAQRQP